MPKSERLLVGATRCAMSVSQPCGGGPICSGRGSCVLGKCVCNVAALQRATESASPPASSSQSPASEAAAPSPSLLARLATLSFTGHDCGEVGVCYSSEVELSGAKCSTSGTGMSQRMQWQRTLRFGQLQVLSRLPRQHLLFRKLHRTKHVFMDQAAFVLRCSVLGRGWQEVVTETAFALRRDCACVGGWTLIPCLRPKHSLLSTLRDNSAALDTQVRRFEWSK